MAFRGSGYIGTSKIEVSEANHEILPKSPSSWTHPYSFYKLSFRNLNPCVVIINKKTEIFLSAGQGFEMNEIDERITSFVIKESGISYTFIGAY